MTGFASFLCPFCQNHFVLQDGKSCSSNQVQMLRTAQGDTAILIEQYVCQNPTCNRATLLGSLWTTKFSKVGQNYEYVRESKLGQWQLQPDSGAKPLPGYIPAPLIADYNEACRIRDLSPKASATLARRCLQGMIRDFWKITKRTLKEEIDTLKNEPKLDLLIWEAIDGTRKLGNIGAHMEADINLIVEVDANEAQLLINLIELLFKEWYISRHQREKQLQMLLGVAAAKESERSK